MSRLATDGLNKANDMYIAATEAAKILTDVAEQFPVIGAVAKLLKYIYERAESAKKNKENCKKTAKRCHTIEIIIANCTKEYKNNTEGPSSTQNIGLDLLVKALQKMSALVEKYINQGKFQRYLKGNQFKEDYADIDKEIDDAMQIVQLGIGSEVMKQNNQLLQQTKFIMEIDESIKSLKETIHVELDDVKTQLLDIKNGHNSNFQQILTKLTSLSLNEGQIEGDAHEYFQEMKDVKLFFELTCYIIYFFL